MPKLATPVQYEPTLEGLNEIRPLQLADESKIVVSYPALCQNPPTKDRPAVGKLARCSEQGALLKSLPVWCDKYETLFWTITNEMPAHFFTFAQKVYGVIVLWQIIEGTPVCDWVSLIPMKELQRITPDIHTFLPFVGVKVRFRGKNIDVWEGDIRVYGFYK